jgi:hypothetical protein
MRSGAEGAAANPAGEFKKGSAKVALEVEQRRFSALRLFAAKEL